MNLLLFWDFTITLTTYDVVLVTDQVFLILTMYAGTSHWPGVPDIDNVRW